MNPAPRPRARPIALVVDDDPMIRLPLTDALEDTCEVHEAEDGFEALDAFARLSPDIVLLDVMMPAVNGFETCLALRRLPGGEHVPVLMMTGLDDVESIQEAYRAGATDFVTKPMSYLIVAQRVLYMLRATRAMEDLRAREREIALDESAARRLALERDLRHAIARDEIEVHYQPQISAVTLEVVGVEALARWRHPGRGLISPAEFIPIAEDTGLIVPLGERVLQIACAQMKRWHDAGLPRMRVAVNVSAKQFQAPGMVATFQRIAAEADLAPSLCELEITESALMDDAEATDAALDALASAGFRLALDDFGTGYSSLSYLKRFPFDALKVDRSFVKDLGNGPSEGRIAAAIIAMAQALELDVVVEGVETEEQLRFVREHGCTDIQGFYFSPPLPAAKLSDWVTTWHRARGSGEHAIAGRAVA